MSRTRAAAVLIGFILMNLTVVPAVWIALRLRLKAHVPLLYLYHRSLCWLMGVRVTVTGEPIKGGLMLANHMGWLDIPVLSITCALSFIAKSEVNSWPMFGFLSRLQRTIFVRRSERGKAREDSEQIRRRLLAGERLVIFAEGTSSDGNRILPFKSALLSAAELPLGEDGAHHVVHTQVQPVTIAYVALFGMPMGRENRPFFAWYGDMDLVPHIVGAFGAGPVDVSVEFHKPLTVDEAGGRKKLALLAERTVRAGLVRALQGRETPAAAADVPLHNVGADEGEDEAEEAA